jgi:hypothetical protein
MPSVRSSSPPPSPYITVISCAKCGNPAYLMRRDPDPQGKPEDELRTFECGTCNRLTQLSTADDQS